MIDVRTTLAALADPVRLAIFHQLLDGPSTPTKLQPQYAISRQAVQQHLEVLVAAGLASSRKAERQRWYTVKPDAARELAHWILRVIGDEVSPP